ncbi:MAG TPA: MBL fold metallo-hydrolase [Alphaproteobacteria bacterium]|nr:MBL fold metallo-hydrolase [Alphaproteobacteria bacterium]
MDLVRQLAESRPDMFSLKPAKAGPAIRINDFIHMSPGLSNAYLLSTEAGRIVINTGMGFESPHHKAAFDAVHPGPTPYIILTQGHTDHVGGVKTFREPGTKLIAQRNNAACQQDDKRINTIRQVQAMIWFAGPIEATAQLMRRPEGGVVQDIPTPDITFDDRLDLELGGLKLELLSVPGGETIDSVAVWLPQHKIVFTGNMFGPLFPHFPNFNTIRGDKYRFVEPYLDSLRRVRALEPEMLITGHFEPIVGRDLIRACLDRLEAAVDHVHRTTLDGMNAKKDIWTLMREVTLPDHLYVGQAYGKVSWAVRTVWEQYMGWFKAQATSELYPTQPKEIYADLVQLAGIDAVVAKGHERLKAGDPEGANLLAEAALAHSPREAGPIELGLAVHRALLERSGQVNFWETGWLKYRINKLDAALARVGCPFPPPED